jgi:predicted DNA-binding transcriptional regulator
LVDAKKIIEEFIASINKSIEEINKSLDKQREQIKRI